MKAFNQNQLELIRRALEQACDENGHLRVAVNLHQLEVLGRGFFKLAGDPEQFPILKRRAVVVILDEAGKVVFSDYVQPCETQRLLARLQTPAGWSVEVSEWSTGRLGSNSDEFEQEMTMTA